MFQFNLTFYNANNQSGDNVTGLGHLDCAVANPEFVKNAIFKEYAAKLMNVGDAVVATDLETNTTINVMVTEGGITCY